MEELKLTQLVVEVALEHVFSTYGGNKDTVGDGRLGGDKPWHFADYNCQNLPHSAWGEARVKGYAAVLER